MLSEKLLNALNEQLNKEYYSSYLYLSMAAYFDDKNLQGMASWMKLQSDEEHEHAMKFFDYIIRVGGRVKLGAIGEPAKEWDNPQSAFEAALEHEKFITKSIYELVDMAVNEKEYATQTFLNWFVDEQVEEEETVNTIVEKFKMIGESASGLYMLDTELGKRSAAAPAVE
jgi:ferritin